MKLSIITICYNNLTGLTRTVNSVVAQSCRSDFEYIIVDGNSNDGTKEYLEEQNDKIDTWISETDTGIYNAMNKGVAIAQGEYILFLNSGDWLHSDKVIEEVSPHLLESDLVIGRVFTPSSGYTSCIKDELTLNRFYKGSIPHPATFTKKTLLVEKPFDESLRIASDWKFFIQTIILDNATYKLIDLIVSDFEPDGISTTNKSLGDHERQTVYKELIPNRIMMDYIAFNEGKGYKDTPYDLFFVQLRKYKYAKYIYAIDVLLIRALSFIKKSARFAKYFPINMDKTQKEQV